MVVLNFSTSVFRNVDKIVLKKLYRNNKILYTHKLMIYL